MRLKWGPGWIRCLPGTTQSYRKDCVCGDIEVWAKSCVLPWFSCLHDQPPWCCPLRPLPSRNVSWRWSNQPESSPTRVNGSVSRWLESVVPATKYCAYCTCNTVLYMYYITERLVHVFVRNTTSHRSCRIARKGQYYLRIYCMGSMCDVILIAHSGHELGYRR